jgi:cyclic-di-GMP phosphodiesterase TipF (flagellum assembly factor)
MSCQLGELFESVERDLARRSEELTGEVRMLEDLVQRMSEGLEQRLSQARPYGAPASHAQHAALLETVREALADNRVDLYLQPVVSLPQRRTVFYESFSRLRDATGRIMMPAEYLSVAEPEGLMSAIDNLLLFRCVQIVRRLAKNDRKVGIFCNISLAASRWTRLTTSTSTSRTSPAPTSTSSRSAPRCCSASSWRSTAGWR